MFLQIDRAYSQACRLPVNPGGSLEGHIDVPGSVGEAVDLRLTCVQTIYGYGDTPNGDVILWDWIGTSYPTRDSSSGNAIIPLRITLPAEAAQSSIPGSRDPIRWKLSASSNVPNFTYEANFLIPVFITTGGVRRGKGPNLKSAN